MYPVLLDFGSVKVYSWGFMLSLGVIAAIVGITRIFKREGYDPEKALDMVIILVLTGLLGSRLAYIAMFEWQDFLAHPAVFFSLSGGAFSGLVWYGGFTASVLAALVYMRYQNYSFWKMADIFSPFLALAYAIVRIGCFLNGCCYGKVSDSACTVVFPYVDDLSRYPTQLFSSGINFLFFAVLLWYYSRRKFSGQIFALYLLAYSVYRFIIEFFRENQVFWGPFSVSQAYSVIIFGLGLGLYIWRQNASAKGLD